MESMRRALLAIFLIGQLHLTAAKLEFEVVSIKLGDPNDPSSSSRSGPASFEMRNTTLNTLVRNAFGLNEFQLLGGPKWAGSARFNMVAKIPPHSSRQDIPSMMQSMLSDRFKLVSHRETRILREYALVVDKGGAKLTRASEEDLAQGGSSQGPRQIKARAATVAELAQMLISAVEAPVVDRTGISGQYNIALRFSPTLNGTPGDNDLPDIFTEIKKLGLRLEALRGPVEVLVIDSAEMPSDN